MPRYFASSPVIAGEEGLFGTWSSFSAARESARSVDMGTLGRNCAGPSKCCVYGSLTQSFVNTYNADATIGRGGYPRFVGTLHSEG